jgi:hypothetical protein
MRPTMPQEAVAAIMRTTALTKRGIASRDRGKDCFVTRSALQRPRYDGTMGADLETPFPLTVTSSGAIPPARRGRRRLPFRLDGEVAVVSRSIERDTSRPGSRGDDRRWS